MNTAIILILGIPLIEIYLFIKVGSEIGALNTILLILMTAVVGIWYARYEGFNTLRSGMSQLVKNELPLYEIVSGAAIAFAALLLILPGFATDIIGILLVFPVTRKIILSKYSKNYSSKSKNNAKYVLIRFINQFKIKLGKNKGVFVSQILKMRTFLSYVLSKMYMSTMFDTLGSILVSCPALCLY